MVDDYKGLFIIHPGTVEGTALPTALFDEPSGWDFDEAGSGQESCSASNWDWGITGFLKKEPALPRVSGLGSFW